MKSLGLIEAALCVIGFAGEPREKKGMHLILSAYAQVCKTVAAALLLVGEIRAGEDRQIFEEFKLSNPDAKFIVIGFISQRDLPEYYSLMDVFVLPSRREGLPNALLEAMACANAVVVTPVGGMLDAVVAEDNGRFVRTNDAGELAVIMKELLADGNARTKLGSTARQTVMNKFTLQAELDGNLAVYRRSGLEI
jgi:glycosyltransferase involved in cell wall biosynthesis